MGGVTQSTTLPHAHMMAVIAVRRHVCLCSRRLPIATHVVMIASYRDKTHSIVSIRP